MIALFSGYLFDRAASVVYGWVEFGNPPGGGDISLPVTVNPPGERDDHDREDVDADPSVGHGLVVDGGIQGAARPDDVRHVVGEGVSHAGCDADTDTDAEEGCGVVVHPVVRRYLVGCGAEGTVGVLEGVCRAADHEVVEHQRRNEGAHADDEESDDDKPGALDVALSLLLVGFLGVTQRAKLFVAFRGFWLEVHDIS